MARSSGGCREQPANRSRLAPVRASNEIRSNETRRLIRRRDVIRADRPGTGRMRVPGVVDDQALTGNARKAVSKAG